MDEKPYKFLKLPQGFGFYQTPTYSHCKCQCNRQPSKLYGRFFRWTFFPTVYADDGKVEGSAIPEVKRPQLFISDEEIQACVLKETGVDRVKEIFTKDHLDNFNPELVNIVNITKGAGFCTFLFMSLLGSIHGKEEFLKKNQHVKFKTRYRAIRSFRDAVFLSGVKVGALYAAKVAAFTLVFFTSSTCVSAYYNRTSVIDFSFGGAVVGSLFRLNLGPKGMFAGGVIGTTIGSVAGLLISGMLRAAGDTYDIHHNRIIHDRLLHEKEAALISAGDMPKEVATNLHVVN